MTLRAAPLPADEARRLKALHELAVLDSAPEASFDQICQLAAQLCAVPIALVSLVDAERQWFKANVGLDGVCETHRDDSFCAHTILGDGVMEVPDARDDPRFAANPLVTGAPGIRFYAGAPIVLADGECIGTLCVIDRVPRRLDAVQASALTGLARLLASTLEQRRARLGLGAALAASEARYRLIVEGQVDLVSLAGVDGTLSFVNTAYAEFFGKQAAEMTGRSLLDHVAARDHDAVRTHLQRVCDEGRVASDANRMVSADGRERWVSWTNRYIPAHLGQPAAIHSVGRDITELRDAEQAMRDEQTRQRVLYEATPAMLHSIDPRGRLLNVSDTWLNTLGYLRHEVIGRPSVDFLSEASRRHATEQVLPAFFATGHCEDVAYQMIKRDGSVIDVLLSAVLERDAQGQPFRSLAVVQDVTERKATAAALSDTTHMLRLVLDSLPARISYWDTDNRCRFANQAFQGWFGTTEAGLRGRHSRELLGEDWYRRLEPSIAEGLAGQARQMEVVAPLADGERRYIDMRFTPDLRDGAVHGLFVFALDITPRRRAELELADREQRLKLLVDGVRDYAICMLDLQGRVETWNAGAERSMAYRAEDVIGRPYHLFFTPEDVADGRPDAALALATRVGRSETEARCRRGDGSGFWANVLLSALYDDSGACIGYAHITRDITEQREHRAATERALAEKETLLKEVYHRVKNNLQVVQSLLTLQGRTLPEGSTRAAIDDSVQRVRAMALVHEKLYQSGDLSAVSLPAYVRDLMAQIAESHRIDRQQVRLHADIPALETGLDSAVPFGLLLTELLTNALKHAFKGRSGGEVWVRLARRGDGDLLTVTDNGVGFDPAAPTRSMGLKLAEGLARQLGGELHARCDGGAQMSALLTRL